MYKTKIFKLKSGWAKHNKLPIMFAGIQLKETQRAVYLYGHGTSETSLTNRCMICGRTLTHPVSVITGIGPECGKHYHDYSVIGGYNKENIDTIMKSLKDIKVDQWLPKSVIVSEVEASQTVVEVPKDHKLLIPKEDPPVSKRIVKEIMHEGIPVLMIQFPYNVEDLDLVRHLDGRRFIPDQKYWIAKRNTHNINSLRDKNFQFDIQETKRQIFNFENSKLFPYQKEGVRFIEQTGGRCIIGDEMGLGKTAQALSWLNVHKEIQKTLIIVPASLKYNWANEVEMWVENPKYQILSGSSPFVTHANILIINYDVLNGWVTYFKQWNPNLIITDECHYYKSNKALRTKAVLKLAKKTKHVLQLSGTPIVNRPIEFYNAIKLADPFLFPNYMEYGRKFCNGKHNGFGWDFNGSSNTELLHKSIQHIIIRRKKADVLKDLPDKVRSFLPIEISNEAQYKEAERNFISFLKQQKGIEAANRASKVEQLAKIEVLKQLAVEGKLKHVKQWISDFMESGEKLVIFATHRKVIDMLHMEFPSVKIDGGVSTEERQKAVDQFQKDPNVKLFIGNIKAAGVGITLTASSNVCFIELPWTPGELSQAEDRCHRIGQKDSVTIHYLLAKNTIEEKVAYMLDLKRQVLSNVLDGKDASDEELLTKLIKTYEIN